MLRDDTWIDPAALPVLAPLPAGRMGNYAVLSRTLPTGANVPYLGSSFRLERETPFSTLTRGCVTLREETPEELARAANAAVLATGDVLVVGLQLGTFVRLASAARSITVVERRPEVAALVWPHVQGDRTRLVAADFARLVLEWQADGPRFDFLYLDLASGLDFEDLPWINDFVMESQVLLKPGGRLLVRGYGARVDAYVADCLAVWRRMRRRPAAWARARLELDGLFDERPMAAWFIETISVLGGPEQMDAAMVRADARRLAESVVPFGRSEWIRSLPGGEMVELAERTDAQEE